jgi:large subunit ribosomal protein L7e
MLLNNVICLCGQEKELVQLKREARMKGGFYVSPEEKLLFVVRIRG